MHPELHAEHCIAESLKIATDAEKDREIARAQVYALLSISHAIEILTMEVEKAAREIGTSIEA